MGSVVKPLIKKINPMAFNYKYIKDLLFSGGYVGAILVPQPSLSGLGVGFIDWRGTEKLIEDTDPLGLLLDVSMGLELGVDEFPSYGAPTVSDSSGSSGSWDGGTNTLSNSAVGTSGTHPRFYFSVPAESYWRKVTHRFSGDVSAINTTGTTVGGSTLVYRSVNGDDFSLELSFILPPGEVGTFYVFADGTSEFSVQMDCKIQELKGHHGSQATTAAKPSYRTDGELHWLEDDLVDDALVISLPDLGTDATLAYATGAGVTILTGQTINGDTELPHVSALYGAIYRDSAFSAEEEAKVIVFLEGLRGG